MSYFFEVTTTGDMIEIDDIKTAMQLYDDCQLECQLSNDDGDIIGEKMFTDDGDNIILESMTEWDEVGHEREKELV